MALFIKLTERERQFRLLRRIAAGPVCECNCSMRDLIALDWPDDPICNNHLPGLQQLSLVRQRKVWVRPYYPLPIWRKKAVWTITAKGRKIAAKASNAKFGEFYKT
jgi:hypothetical protein